MAALSVLNGLAVEGVSRAPLRPQRVDCFGVDAEAARAHEQFSPADRLGERLAAGAPAIRLA